MDERADFYVGRGKDAEWLGSINWNGYPKALALESEGVDLPVLGQPDVTVSTFRSLGGTKTLTATTEAMFREGVEELATSRVDFVSPAQGWPWPWPSSALTDYAYAYDGDAVYASHRGSEWFVVDLKRAKGGEPPKNTTPEPAGVPFPRMVEYMSNERVR